MLSSCAPLAGLLYDPNAASSAQASRGAMNSSRGGDQKAAHDGEEHPLVAIGLVLGAMFLFTTTDGAAKYLTGALPAEQIIWMRYVVVSTILAPILLHRRADGLLRTRRPGLHVLRGLLLMTSGLLFVSALGHLPLELATAIGFVSPLYVTALSIPLLGEHVGVRRWTAVGIGFLGVLVILRPGGAAFTPAMLLPLASSFCWAIGLIITRRMRGEAHALTVLTYSSFAGLIASAPLAWLVWRSPTPGQWALLGAIGVLNALAQYLIIRAFMLAPASLLAPFSYSTIVWAVLIGALVFGSYPDPVSLAGTVILIGAGLYVWHRERALTMPSTAPGASISEVAEISEDPPLSNDIHQREV